MERGDADLSVSRQIAARQEDERGGADGSDEIAAPDGDPGLHHLGGLELARGPGHDHQRVAGEEPRARRHHQNEAEREGDAAQKPRHAVGHQARIARHGDGGEHGADRDESARRDRQDEEIRPVVIRLLRPRSSALTAILSGMIASTPGETPLWGRAGSSCRSRMFEVP